MATANDPSPLRRVAGFPDVMGTRHVQFELRIQDQGRNVVHDRVKIKETVNDKLRSSVPLSPYPLFPVVRIRAGGRLGQSMLPYESRKSALQRKYLSQEFWVSFPRSKDREQ